MADLSFLLSPQDRAKLGRQVGINLPDGRRFKNGVLVSAQDAANTDATSAMNAGFSAQGGPNPNRSASINPRQMGDDVYRARMADNWSANGYNPSQNQAQPQVAQMAGGYSPSAPAIQGGGAQPAQGMPQVGPYDDMLNRARLLQQTYQAGGSPSVSATVVPLSSAGASGGAPAPYNANATATVGGRNFGGPSGEAFPAPQGYGFPEMPASVDQQQAYAAQNGPKPAVDLLRPRSVEEISKMSPAQRAGLVQFGQEQQNQGLQTRQKEAEIAKTTAAAQPKPADLSFQEQNVAAQIQAKEAELGRALNTKERADVFNQVATSSSPTGNPNDKLQADSVKARMEDERTTYKNSVSSASFAKQAERAIEAGAKTGTFAGIAGSLKNLGESLGIGDLGASEQAIAQKGLAGLQSTGVRAIMQGLGSMSNADRDFATASLPRISDPKQSIQFYVDLAKENERLAKEDAGFVRKLEREKVDQAEIYRRLDEVRETRNVAEGVFAKVTGNKPASTAQASSAAQPAAPASAPNIEELLKKYR